MTFRDDFVWGTATAAYQVEGGALADGKGPSVWDMLCRTPGAIWNGLTGEVACDHYHHFREDVALMQRLGYPAYRMSVAWARVLPEGVGPVNPAGLGFYDALIDALLAANITPYLTLYHWDMPYALYQRGGWLNPASSAWFADYVQVVVERLSDRVRHWMTFNEPQIFMGLGHQDGIHAPGLKWNLPEVLQASHHVLLAHGRAVQAIRAGAKQPPQVGLAQVGVAGVPATNTPADIEAARAACMASLTWEGGVVRSNTWWDDPIFFKHYPEDGLAAAGAAAPKVKAGDFDVIAQPLDFLGLNIYGGRRVRAGANGQPEELPLAHGVPLTAYYWPVVPDALYWGPRFLYERYGLPIYLTENGMANTDWVAEDGAVHDPQRIDYTRRYLKALRRAAADGVDLRGYFHWTLMDNFEWAEGFRQRFGLVYVDFNTQQRVPKDSAYWYQQVIASNGASLES